MHDDYDDSPDWTPLADVVAEMGMTRDQLLLRYPHLDIDHTAHDGEPIIDRRQLDG